MFRQEAQARSTGSFFARGYAMVQHLSFTATAFYTVLNSGCVSRDREKFERDRDKAEISLGRAAQRHLQRIELVISTYHSLLTMAVLTTLRPTRLQRI